MQRRGRVGSEPHSYQYAIIVAMQLARMGPSRKREGILGMQGATGPVTGQYTGLLP